MSKTSRIFAIILVLSLIFATATAFTACNDKNNDYKKPISVKIVVPDGAPALAVAKLMNDKPTVDGIKTSFEIVDGAGEITTKITGNAADAAIVPTNLAAVLYNKNADITLVSVNVHGLLYLVGAKGSAAENIADLTGKVVYNIGRGGTPDLTFKYILSKNNIKYVESETPVEGKVALHYVSSGSELIPLLKQGKAHFGILGEPAATQSTKAAETKILFDIQKLWNEASGTTAKIPQASLIVKKSLAENNPEFVAELIGKITENDEWILNNSDKLNGIMQSNGSKIKAAFSKDVVERCNIASESAQAAKADVRAYLEVLYGFSPKSVGGKLPDDNFFYEN